MWFDENQQTISFEQQNSLEKKRLKKKTFEKKSLKKNRLNKKFMKKKQIIKIRCFRTENGWKRAHKILQLTFTQAYTILHNNYIYH